MSEMASEVRHRHMSTVCQMSHFIRGQGTQPLSKCTNNKDYIVKVPNKNYYWQKRVQTHIVQQLFATFSK